MTDHSTPDRATPPDGGRARPLDPVLAQLPAAVAVLRGPEYVVETMNDACARLFGRRPIGRRILDAFPDAAALGFLAPLDEVYRTGVPHTAREARLHWDRDGDGVRRDGWVDYAYHPVRAATGAVDGVLVFAVDVTAAVDARREAEALAARTQEQAAELELRLGQQRALTEELQASERRQDALIGALAHERERLARVVAQLPAAVAVYEGPGHVVRAVSAAYRAIVGGRDIVGLPLRAALPDLDARFFALLDGVYATGERASGQGVPARWDADGDGVPEDHVVDFGYHPLVGVDGRVEGVVALVVDVTARARAEEALRRSEERYELAARAASNAIWDWDLVTDEIGWNEGLHTLFGYGRGEVEPTARWWYDHIHPDDRLRVAEGIHAVIDGAAGGHEWEAEYRFRRRDGTHAQVVDRGYVARDGAGRAARMVGAMTDVSAERAARAAAERERADLLAVLDVVPVGIGIARDPGCERIHVNATFADQLGVPREVNVSKTAEHAALLPFRVRDPARGGAEVPGHDLPMQRAAREDVRVDGAEYDIERADGRVLRLLEYAAPLHDAEGRVRGAVGAFVDVTERARLEAAERAARAEAEAAGRRLALLAEAGAALGVSLDPEEISRAVSRVSLPTLGDYCLVDLVESAWDGQDARAAAAGAPAPDVTLRRAFLGHRDPAREAAIAPLARRTAPDPRAAGSPMMVALRTGAVHLVQPVDAAARERFARDPEHLAVVRALACTAAISVPLSAAGRTLGVLTFCTAEPSAGGTGRQYTPEDVTLAVEIGRRAATALEHARLYQETERARQQAEEASRAKSDFLAVMSHELRTPLNSVLGHQDLLALGIHGPVTDAQAEALGRIRRSGTLLLSLINDVLNYARLDAGHVAFDVRPVPLADALAELEGFVAPQLEARRLAYRVLPPDPSLRVAADRDKLQQVLLNLLTNAVKFTPEGGAIEVSAEAAADVARVRVRDTGVGIPRDKLESIFQPFVQVNQRRTREHEGVGLGLAISRDLAHGMGGDLAAESEPGTGSTFTLTLRRA